jgi:hypothetical protein
VSLDLSLIFCVYVFTSSLSLSLSLTHTHTHTQRVLDKKDIMHQLGSVDGVAELQIFASEVSSDSAELHKQGMYCLCMSVCDCVPMYVSACVCVNVSSAILL